MHSSFFYKLNDKKYIIQSIRGVIIFSEINECLDKQKELSLFVKEMLNHIDIIDSSKFLEYINMSVDQYIKKLIDQIDGGNKEWHCQYKNKKNQ